MSRNQIWMAGAMLMVAACTSEQAPTGPDADLARAATGMAEANTWTSLSPHSFGGFYQVIAGAASDGRRVYVVGGINDEGGIASGVRIYRPGMDTWTSERFDFFFRFAGNGLASIGGKVYIAGGYHGDDGIPNFSHQLHVYDPVAHTLTRKADTPRGLAEGVVGVIDGKLYLLPGQCDANYWPRPGQCQDLPIRRLFRYNPATDRWANLGSAPHHHRNGAAGVIGGKLYVVGGRNPTGSEASLDVYDPGTNTWKTLAPIPTPGEAIGTALAGKLYVIVGSKAHVYDPGTNQWSPIAAPANSSHQALVRVVIGGQPRLLAFGGHLAPCCSTAAPSELYTP